MSAIQQILAAMGGAAPITPISLVAHLGAESAGHGTFTTSAIDTTTATLLVVGVNALTASLGAPTDSNSNVYVPLTAYGSGGAFFPTSSQIYYCKNPVVGPGHTFTNNGASSYASLFVQAFTNTDTTANADGDLGAGDPGATSIQPGALLPTRNNSVVVTLFGIGSPGTFSIDSGFTITDKIESVAVGNVIGGMAYLVQTTAASVNPTISTTGVADRIEAAQTSFFLS